MTEAIEFPSGFQHITQPFQSKMQHDKCAPAHVIAFENLKIILFDKGLLHAVLINLMITMCSELQPVQSIIEIAASQALLCILNPSLHIPLMTISHFCMEKYQSRQAVVDAPLTT